MIISNLSDVAGTGEDRGKGETPKRSIPDGALSGRMVNIHVTVIRMDGGLLKAKELLIRTLRADHWCQPYFSLKGEHVR